MKENMKEGMKENITSLRLLVAWIVCVVSVPLLAAGVYEKDKMVIISAAATGLVWEQSEEGVGFAPLVGDRFVEPYMAMVRLPAGLVSPAHVKTSNMFGVVVSGTMIHVVADVERPKEVLLPEGSFYKIPAGLAHISKCVSETACITFLYQDGKFDFLQTNE